MLGTNYEIVLSLFAMGNTLTYTVANLVLQSKRLISTRTACASRNAAGLWGDFRRG